MREAQTVCLCTPVLLRAMLESLHYKLIRSNGHQGSRIDSEPVSAQKILKQRSPGETKDVIDC